MVMNLPCNAGDTGSILGQGIKIPHKAEQRSICPTTAEPECPNLESPCATSKGPA